MCKVLKVSRSGYYKWLHKTPSKRVLTNAILTKEIHRIYKCSLGRYGSPRVTRELHSQGVKASKVLVAKLMKREHLRSIIRKKYITTTDSSHNYPIVENILNREFAVDAKNKAWVSDITYINTAQGWTYLTTVIDLYDRKVIGWALSNRMYTKQTSIAALKMALNNRPIQANESLIFHSDRGIQYACDEFVKEISKHANIKRSMSRKGNCWDNAVAESFFKTLKVELVYHHKYKSREQAGLSIFEYIETFYNTNRRHKQLNNLTIKEFNKLINNNLKNAA
jgi:transposase InsO family protein